MPVLFTELLAYSSGAWTANPDDSVTSSPTAYGGIVAAITGPTLGGVFGGAIDLTTRVILAQITGTDTVQILSDGADVRTATIVGRLASGILAAEVLTLNGVTPVTSANTYERIQSVTLSATSVTRVFTLRRTTGAVLIVNIGGVAPADATEIRATMMFRNSTIPLSGTTERYEKLFWKNANAAAIALTSAIVSQGADPLSRIRHGLAAAVNDSLTVANRITAPAGVSFADTAITVPGGGNIAAGSQIGVWLNESLPSGDSPFKNTYTSQLDGNTVA